MSISDKRETPGDRLLAQDPPSDQQRRRREDLLFAQIERRIRRDKVIVGGIYLLVFAAAFWALLQTDKTDDPIHSLAWGTVSLHVLLWFLVYFLRSSYRLLATVAATASGPSKRGDWKRDDRFVTIVAVVVFVLSSALLHRSFSAPNTLRAVRLATHLLWAPVFFFFWYPFGTASLVGKLWLEYKKAQLHP